MLQGGLIVGKNVIIFQKMASRFFPICINTVPETTRKKNVYCESNSW